MDTYIISMKSMETMKKINDTFYLSMKIMETMKKISTQREKEGKSIDPPNNPQRKESRKTRALDGVMSRQNPMSFRVSRTHKNLIKST